MLIFGPSSIVLQNAALGVKMMQYQCLPPYLLRFNSPNLEEIEMEDILAVVSKTLYAYDDHMKKSI